MNSTATSSLLAIFDVGGGEMILIFVVVLLLFGGKRMPELARGLGKSLNEFKKATSGVEAQIKQAMDDVRETATTTQKTIKSTVVTPEITATIADPVEITPPAAPPTPPFDASPAPPEDTR